MKTLDLGAINLELVDEIEAGFTDFCTTSGTIEFRANAGFLGNENLRLFSISGHDFLFEAKISRNMVFVRRNKHYQSSEECDSPNETWEVAIQWDTDSIGCGIMRPGENMNEHMRAVRTEFTSPSLNIIHDLRLNNLLNCKNYKSASDVFTTIIDSIDFAEAHIQKFGAEKYFWNNSGGKYSPMREPEISRQFAPHLQSQGASRNFDVFCEPVSGSGNVDFHVTAPLTGGRLAKISIEAKKAESTDLVMGLSKQLPEYMRTGESDYGIFLTYWMRSFDYLFPSYQTYADLDFELLHPISRPPNVRTLCLDLSRKKSPSKL